jgi:hypothetical protein
VLLLLAGRDAEGVGMLQQVVDLHPRTAEADVAAAALAQVGAPRETTPQRLRTVYILPLGRRDPRRRAALDRLVAGREGATAREFDDLVDACLAGDLAAWKQLATVHDMRASELLHEGLRSSEKIAIIVEAARGLFAREGSEVPLAEAVARIDDELFLQGPYTGAELDAALRPLTGEGPALATDPAPDLHVAARAWRTWLASCGYR